ncbi:MAG: rRNA adenine N-6-methyltransferase family protein, partial [Candidatus Aminicenantales bacterium]
MKRSRRKALGQHFLVSRRVLKKIIQTIDPQPQDLIIEIGPGKGALTFPLAKKAGKVIAIEKDISLASNLRRKMPHL